MSAPGDEICIGSDAQVKEFDNYLHQHEFDPPKMLRKLKLYCNNSS
jgi:CPA2 family monovalent cation:H+ antiporter-2